MSPLDALRARRADGDLPDMTSDDDLVAWGRSLAKVPGAAAGPPHPRRTEPLRAERRTPPPPPPAVRRAPAPAPAPVEPAPSRIRLRRRG